jgi:6-pyruvoyltetrahydropterin/6-carboxytetrahydropterin synthase
MIPHGAFRVHVTKDYLVFSSAHFITFAGHRCESLHGHNYRVGVAVEGAIDTESWYVLDFSVLKRLTKELCDEIDHKVLLPLTNPKLTVDVRGESVAVAYQGTPRYVFPLFDCALLDISNTTVEMLAQYLTRRLRVALPTAVHATAIEVEVEENFGQSAVYREQIDGPRGSDADAPSETR